MSNLRTLSKSFLSEPGVVGTGPASQWRAKWPAEVTVPSWWTLVFFHGHLSSEQIWTHSDFRLADNCNVLGSPGHLWTTLWWQPCPFHQGMPYYILALHFSFFMPPFLYFLLLASDEHLPVSSSELPCYLGFDEPADPLTIPSFTEVPWRILYPLSCISFCPTIIKARVLLHVNLFIPCLLLSTQTKLHGAKILFAPRVQMYWLNDYYMTKLIRA